MKFIKNTLKYAGLGLAMTLSLSSCEKYFDGVNDNPNNPSDVTPDVLLPSIQGHLAYAIGGDASRYTSMFTQQVTGVSRQWATASKYQVSESDTDNLWRFNLYGGPMNDLYILMQKASENGWTQYGGVAKVMMAYSLMTTTDMFDDIPYSQAFLGFDNLQPSYDTQEEIYTAIMALLTDAKADLAADPAPVAPGSDDLLYGGDTDQWTKTANVLMARAHIHLGNVNSSHYQSALDALGAEGTDSYGSNGDDATYWFGTSETAAGPWYQFNDQRGDISFSGFMVDTMIVMGDPRLAAWADTATGGMGTYFGVANAPFEFASYVEQKFIEAEAAFQTGDATRAADAHNAAVLASLSKLGVSDATFEANEAAETAGSITLEKIMLHKYIAMYTNPEAWVDWRRTDYPTLTPVANNVTSDIIPRRLPYPLSERSYNPNMPAKQPITAPVWWDQ